ncbi:extracellular solute-binding protein [Hyphomicrobium sp. CS1BSMeth3]|uniref:ABC transporter substrate-binding protein n=1 Tax=Hyphomicrobium sp. CS1BSMeth3 TaxID=1892844 RepID=UPI00157741FE|nr:extracellular solute-binding protein [Hyphomicrobium sp. CS1BSMeth3]MBN9264432.1 extracellular solute-binding protein [Hyphomicrobium sp.]
MSRVSRRDLLKYSAAAAAMPMTSILPALANDKRVVFGTWGGDSERILRETMAVVAKERYGIEVVFDVGTPSARKTKLIAQASRPRNTMDIPWLVDSDMYQMSARKIVKNIVPADIPNYENLIEDFRTDYSVPNCYGALVLVYNNSVTPPASIKDLWRKEYAGQIGVTDLSYDKIIPMASVAFGGSTSNYAPGYEALLELKKNGVRVYASNEAVGAALKSGEVKIALMWKGRAYTWQQQGVPISYVTPSEGAYPTFFVMGVTSNTGVPELANQVLGAALDPEVQVAVARVIGQVPTVKNAKLPPDLEAGIGFSEADRAKFIKADHAYAAEKASEAREFWNQKFKG